MPSEMYPPRDVKSGYRLVAIHDGMTNHSGTATKDAETARSTLGPETTITLECGPCSKQHTVKLPAFRLIAVNRTIQ